MEKKKLAITGPEKVVADALPHCAKETELGLRVKSALRCIAEYYRGKKIKVSASTIYRGVARLVKRKILEPVEMRKAPGEKRPSLLYHFNKDLFDKYEFEVEGRTRRQPERKQLKLKKASLHDLIRRTVVSYAEARKKIKNKKTKIQNLQREKKRVEREIATLEKEVSRLEREMVAFENFLSKIKK